jgi:hypothetical protein
MTDDDHPPLTRVYWLLMEGRERELRELTADEPRAGA